MTPPAKFAIVVMLLLAPAHATAQQTLGQLLDEGATRLSPDEFKDQVMQRIVEGPIAGGGVVLMYAATGQIQGRATFPLAVRDFPITGEWSLDDHERVCTALRLDVPNTTVLAGMSANLPMRCQHWFKLADAYFISDSDSDRQAKVLKRTLKK
ncbi:MAG TPA: hypothetical protein VMU79_00370 [Casimicrobiaceae bacterium]|jgi:hypothetical protein|nr:hypothetical protein [Casimicrobiaceae bacterium]